LQRENRPCSGHSQESPRTTANKLHSTPSINTRSTSLHRSRSLSGHCPSSAPRLSPLVAGQVTNVLVSADKVGIRRQISEPRLLQRSTQKRRLTKSSSVDWLFLLWTCKHCEHVARTSYIRIAQLWTIKIYIKCHCYMDRRRHRII
jgi:hypothetical protein